MIPQDDIMFLTAAVNHDLSEFRTFISQAYLEKVRLKIIKMTSTWGQSASARGSVCLHHAAPLWGKRSMSDKTPTIFIDTRNCSKRKKERERKTLTGVWKCG